MPCDARMNSVRNHARRVRRPEATSYTEWTMTGHSTSVRLARWQQGNSGSSLGQARVAMAEVQICGIPKLSMLEVALT